MQHMKGCTQMTKINTLKRGENVTLNTKWNGLVAQCDYGVSVKIADKQYAEYQLSHAIDFRGCFPEALRANLVSDGQPLDTMLPMLNKAIQAIRVDQQRKFRGVKVEKRTTEEFGVPVEVHTLTIREKADPMEKAKKALQGLSKEERLELLKALRED